MRPRDDHVRGAVVRASAEILEQQKDLDFCARVVSDVDVSSEIMLESSDVNLLVRLGSPGSMYWDLLRTRGETEFPICFVNIAGQHMVHS